MIISAPFSQDNPRLLALRLLVATGLVLLIGALFRVQVLHHDRYGQRLAAQSLRRIRLPSIRGEIVDRHGTILANNRASYDIVIYLEQLASGSKREDVVLAAGATLTALSRVLGQPVRLTERDVRLHYQKRRPIPLPVWRDLDSNQVSAFAERGYNLPGADLVATPVRQYPGGTLAAHVLGYVGRAAPEQDKAAEEIEHYYYYQPDSVGRQGVERSYDEFLRGAPGGRTVQVSPTGMLVGEIGAKPAERGDRLVLTIDARAQQIVEGALDHAPLPEGRSRSGAAVLLDARTGEVLALASRPAFDPNLFNPGAPAETVWALLNDPSHPLLNRGYGGLYAPGSTFKPVTLLAGLQSGAIHPQDTVVCRGSLQIGTWPRPFGCWNRPGHGTVDALSAMRESCDVWFYQKGLATGVDAIGRLAAEFGLGQPTGIDIGNEHSGLVPTPAWKRQAKGERWWDGDTAQLAIGQSFLQVTPLQMAVLVAAFANGGNVLRPFVVSRVERADGTVLRRATVTVAHHVSVSPANLDTVRRALRAAVQEPSGTAHRAAIREVPVAGKTGTAEYDTPSGRAKRAWFIGFAPYDQPQYALALVLDDAESGGHNAAPAAGEVFANLFGHDVAATAGGGGD